MTTDWLGGGLIVALAAVLWLIYLLPTWFRRNEFLSTERNVVRLQQTLRILAETSEVPDEVHVEANARSVVEQQRVLKKANAQNLLAERAGLQTLIEQGLAAQAAGRASSVEGPQALTPGADDASFSGDGDYETIVLAERPAAPTFRQASLKLRRARAATTGILLLALVVTVLGAVQIAVNGAWVVLVVGLVAATLCVTRLGRLARDGRALHRRGVEGGFPVAENVAGQTRRAGASARGRTAKAGGAVFSDESLAEATLDEAATVADAFVLVDDSPTVDSRRQASAAEQAGAEGDSGWIPVPLPKPLYVGHRRIDGHMPVPAYVAETAERAEQALRAAARDSEQALRASQRAETASDASAEGGHPEAAPVVAPVAATPVPQAAPNRFASMGVVDVAETGAIDVDRVLARRRAG